MVPSVTYNSACISCRNSPTAVYYTKARAWRGGVLYVYWPHCAYEVLRTYVTAYYLQYTVYFTRTPNLLLIKLENRFMGPERQDKDQNLCIRHVP